MQARALLMIEHRLIERMIERIKKVLSDIEKTGKADPLFVDTAVDFIRVYADRTHHGKEEDIMFSGLKARALSEEDRKVMDELIKDHEFGRKTTKDLVAANDRYRAGDESALSDIVLKLRTIAEFYPQHIVKEDKVFFPAAREYFSKEEDQNMLAEFEKFDQKMIHEKYTRLVERLEKQSGQAGR